MTLNRQFVLADCLALLNQKSPDLALVVARSDTLPAAVQTDILAMVHATEPGREQLPSANKSLNLTCKSMPPGLTCVRQILLLGHGAASQTILSRLTFLPAATGLRLSRHDP